MTLFHFINCAVLAYAPFVIAYKYSALNEYSSYWKCAQAAAIYLGTQFIKMMALATFFPATETDEFNLFLVYAYKKSNSMILFLDFRSF
jgi:hypothetical protein